MDNIPNRPNGMVIRPEEIEPIVEAIRAVDNCKFLVFGCGRDTPFWDEVNKDGRTVFLENYEDWIDETKKHNPERDLEIYKVEYHTELHKFEEYKKKELSFFEMDLPEAVSSTVWDVILVDSPVGKCTRSHNRKYGKPAPGRMSSIYMSHKLVKDLGTVFIHDITRPAERYFGDKVFGKENLNLKVAYLGRYIKKV